MRTEGTQQFTLAIGLAAGYDPTALRQGEAEVLVAGVARAWQHLMAREGDVSGVYPSAVFHSGTAVYHNEAVSPPGGEPLAVAFGTRNPKYAPDEDAWKRAVLRVVGEMKRAFRQTTCQVSFVDVSMVYYEADD